MPSQTTLDRYYPRAPWYLNPYVRAAGKAGAKWAAKAAKDYMKGPWPKATTTTKSKKSTGKFRYTALGTRTLTNFARPKGKYKKRQLHGPKGVVRHGPGYRKVKLLKTKFDETCTATTFFADPDCIDTNNVIGKLRPFCTPTSSDNEHGYGIIQNLTHQMWHQFPQGYRKVVAPTVDADGEDIHEPISSDVSGAVENGAPVYCTRFDNKTIQMGLTDQKASGPVRFNPFICQNRIPRSADFSKFKFPTYVLSGVKVNFSFTNLSILPQQVFIKCCRLKKPAPQNMRPDDINFYPYVQEMMNGYQTDRESFDVLWQTSKVLPQRQPGINPRSYRVNKYIKTNFIISNTHKRSTAKDADTLVSFSKPIWKEDESEVFNSTFLVLFITPVRTKQIAWINKTTGATSEAWDTYINRPEIQDVNAGGVLVQGYTKRHMRVKDVLSPNSVKEQAATKALHDELNSRLAVIEAHHQATEDYNNHPLSYEKGHGDSQENYQNTTPLIDYKFEPSSTPHQYDVSASDGTTGTIDYHPPTDTFSNPVTLGWTASSMSTTKDAHGNVTAINIPSSSLVLNRQNN